MPFFWFPLDIAMNDAVCENVEASLTIENQPHVTQHMFRNVTDFVLTHILVIIVEPLLMLFASSDVLMLMAMAVAYVDVCACIMAMVIGVESLYVVAAPGSALTVLCARAVFETLGYNVDPVYINAVTAAYALISMFRVAHLTNIWYVMHRTGLLPC